MDAPLITLDDAANTTDVYAFVSQRDGEKYLTTALAVYPFEEPGIGPNKYNFDDDVLYEIHVATGSDARAGRATYSLPVRVQDDVQKPQHDPPVVPRRRQRRRRRGAEPDPALHRDASRRPQRRSRRSSAPASCRRTTRATRRRSTTRATTARTRPRTAWRPSRARSVHGAVDRRARRTATARSPASATTASTPTSRRSSTC